jgi:UDP-N-acetylglucosamine 2-epimerase (non-hydrolysing)
MAPLVRELLARSEVRLKICVTAQHREMLDQVMDMFDITADYDLGIMQPGQDLYDLTSRLLLELKPILHRERPDLVLVHGDTTTTMAVSLASYYARIPVGHVEAGLRTRDKFQPFPEEVNRQVTGVLADLHFSPTERAKQNLLNESVPENKVFVTGNTVIDALLTIHERVTHDKSVEKNMVQRCPWLDKYKRMVLVTGHRRENFGRGFREICEALVELARMYPEVSFVYPVHLNPEVSAPVDSILRKAGLENVYLIEPLDYASFVYMLDRCYLVLTDSGGIQEEAPSLGKPVVVMRETTERPEAVEAGTAILAGNSKAMIIDSVSRLLDDQPWYQSMSQAINPYGDGHAARRIADIVVRYLTTE